MWQKISPPLRGVLFFTAILAFWNGRAQSTTVTVGCTGASGSFNFTTINDAVNSLAASGKSGHEIDISGTCTETVFLEGWDHLQLIGKAGATIVAPSTLGNCAPFTPGCPGAVLVITESKAVGVRGLVLQGAGPSGTPPAFIDDSTVDFFQCTFQNGGGSDSGGLFIVGLSRVLVSKSIFQDNQPSGLRVDPGGVVQINDSVVQRNGVLGGIRVFGGHANVFGFNLIQNNAGAGIEVDRGRVHLFAFDSQPQIANNQLGIFLTGGGQMAANGRVLIQGNSQFGVLLDSASSAILGGTLSSTQAPLIQQNGTAGSFFSSGILVRGNSTLHLNSGQVTNNFGPGVIVRNDSSASIANETITGNSGEGIRVFILSSAQVFGDTISGNNGVDLRCSPDSFGSGNSTGIGKMFCPNFNVEPLPGPKP